MSDYFKKGDIIKVTSAGQILLCKILAQNDDTYHVLVRSHDTGDGPDLAADFDSFPVMSMYSPFAVTAFTAENSVKLGQSDVKQDDLVGYFAFLKQNDFNQYLIESNQDPKAIIAMATSAYEEAIRLSDEGLQDEAIAKYEAAIDTFPMFFEALDNMALLKGEMGDHESAKEIYIKSLAINPNNITALCGLGHSYRMLGDMKEARNLFNKCIEIEPDNVFAQEGLKVIDAHDHAENDKILNELDKFIEDIHDKD